MNLLIVGDCHAYGHGLHTGQSFIEQFIRRLRRINRAVNVDYYVPVAMQAVTDLLEQVSLERYDLIILQVGNYECQEPPVFKNLFRQKEGAEKAEPAQPIGFPGEPLDWVALRRCSPAQPPTLRLNVYKWLKARGSLVLLRCLARYKRLSRFRALEQSLAAIFSQLLPHRRRVILMTPFPHRESVSGWMRREGRRIFLESGRRIGISVIDTHLLVQPREEYYLPNDEGNLNAVGHELIGSGLYDFYLAAPTVSSMPSAKNQQ